MYLSTMLEATTFMKPASMLEAIARARRVFPVPGGPYIKIPLGAAIPTLLKSSGFVSGSSIASRSVLICSFSPPISEKLILPGSLRK